MLGTGIRVALGPLRFIYKNSNWLQSCSTTHRFAEKYVGKALAYRKASSSKPSDIADGVGLKNLLHAMAAATDDKVVLRNEILQALMAAQETTASLISNVFLLLSRHQDEWERLQDEVQGIGTRHLDADLLISMTHLRRVLNEGEHYLTRKRGFCSRVM